MQWLHAQDHVARAHDVVGGDLLVWPSLLFVVEAESSFVLVWLTVIRGELFNEGGVFLASERSNLGGVVGSSDGNSEDDRFGDDSELSVLRRFSGVTGVLALRFFDRRRSISWSISMLLKDTELMVLHLKW